MEMKLKQAFTRKAMGDHDFNMLVARICSNVRHGDREIKDLQDCNCPACLEAIKRLKDHTVGYSYACGDCPEVFMNKRDLHKHALEKHNIDLEQRIPITYSRFIEG